MTKDSSDDLFKATRASESQGVYVPELAIVNAFDLVAIHSSSQLMDPGNTTYVVVTGANRFAGPIFWTR